MRLSEAHVHIDCFSTSLSDLPAKVKRNPELVFDAIVSKGGFSTFDVDDHLAGPVTYLFQSGLLRDLKTPYPWVGCEPTERGLQWRAGAAHECPGCSGAGYLSVRVSRRTRIAAPCTECSSTGWVEAGRRALKEQGDG